MNEKPSFMDRVLSLFSVFCPHTRVKLELVDSNKKFFVYSRLCLKCKKRELIKMVHISKNRYEAIELGGSFKNIKDFLRAREIKENKA